MRDGDFSWLGGEGIRSASLGLAWATDCLLSRDPREENRELRPELCQRHTPLLSSRFFILAPPSRNVEHIGTEKPSYFFLNLCQVLTSEDNPSYARTESKEGLKEKKEESQNPEA